MEIPNSYLTQEAFEWWCNLYDRKRFGVIQAAYDNHCAMTKKVFIVK